MGRTEYTRKHPSFAYHTIHSYEPYSCLWNAEVTGRVPSAVTHLPSHPVQRGPPTENYPRCMHFFWISSDKRNENQLSFPSFPSERPTHLNSACPQWRENGERTTRNLPGGREGARGGPRCRASGLRHMHYTQSHLWLIFKRGRGAAERHGERLIWKEASLEQHAEQAELNAQIK